jgi:hypothetical protein
MNDDPKKETEYHPIFICHTERNMKFALVDFAQCFKMLFVIECMSGKFILSEDDQVSFMCLVILKETVFIILTTEDIFPKKTAVCK